MSKGNQIREVKQIIEVENILIEVIISSRPLILNQMGLKVLALFLGLDLHRIALASVKFEAKF